MRAAATLSLACALAMAACGGPEPKMVAAKHDDGVPANSASEERLKASGSSSSSSSNEASAAHRGASDSHAETTPIAGMPTATSGAAGAAGASGSAASTPNKPGAKKNPKDKVGAAAGTTGSKVSKTECNLLFEHFIDLSIGSDERLQGIPSEVIAQLKRQAQTEAKAQKGDPCDSQEVTRAQYNCAITATTAAAWQACLQ